MTARRVRWACALLIWAIPFVRSAHSQETAAVDVCPLPGNLKTCKEKDWPCLARMYEERLGSTNDMTCLRPLGLAYMHHGEEENRADRLRQAADCFMEAKRSSASRTLLEKLQAKIDDINTKLRAFPPLSPGVAPPACLSPSTRSKLLQRDAGEHEKLGELRRAAEAINRAYELAPELRLLLRLAELWERIGDREKSEAAYENTVGFLGRYKDRLSDPKEAAQVQTDRIEPVLKKLESFKPKAPPPPPAPSRPLRTAGITLLSAGAVGALASLAFLKPRNDAANEANASGHLPDWIAARDRATQWETAMYAGLAAGGAVIVVGAILTATGRGEPKKASAFYLLPAGVGLVAGGRFQ